MLCADRRPHRQHLLPGALLLGLIALQPAEARQDDRQQQMDIDGDAIDGYYQPNHVTTVTGRVVGVQGTLKLTGEVAKVYLDGSSRISRIVVTGKPAHIQQLDDSGNLMSGEASTLDYDNLHGIATLIAGAVVRQHCRGEAHGDRLTYNTQTSQILGESSGEKTVHMTFLPKNPPGPSPAQPGCSAPTGSR